MGIGLGLKALLGEILLHYMKLTLRTTLTSMLLMEKSMPRQAIRVTERSQNLVTDASTGSLGNTGNTGRQESGQRVRGGGSRAMGGGTTIEIVRNKNPLRFTAQLWGSHELKKMMLMGFFNNM